MVLYVPFMFQGTTDLLLYSLSKVTGEKQCGE